MLWLLTDSELNEKYKGSVIFLNAKSQQMEKILLPCVS